MVYFTVPPPLATVATRRSGYVAHIAVAADSSSTILAPCVPRRMGTEYRRNDLVVQATVICEPIEPAWRRRRRVINERQLLVAIDRRRMGTCQAPQAGVPRLRLIAGRLIGHRSSSLRTPQLNAGFAVGNPASSSSFRATWTAVHCRSPSAVS